MKRVDVFVVGAGTAGAAAAAACADSGLSVVCADARPLVEAGAQWCNGVPAWAFDQAGFEQPSGPELRGGGTAFHIVAGWGPERVTIEGSTVIEVDMRHLTARLLARAAASGAELRGSTAVRGLESVEGGSRVRLENGDSFVADVVVDASGWRGAGIAPRPSIERGELCTASQFVYEVADLQAARAWFQARDVKPGEPLCFTGVAGGYSIVNVRLDDGAHPHASVLTGSIPADGHASGPVLLRRFVADHAWLGRPLFGGSRAVPVGLPAPRLDHGRVALLGDSGVQVFGAHGSGIGAQLVAARLLADALKAGQGPAEYNLRWQRRWGGQLAASSVFARFSRSFTAREMTGLVGSGLMAPGIVRGTLEQRTPAPSLADLASLVRGGLRERALARRLLPVLRQIAGIQAHYKRYPRQMAALPRWLERRDRILRRLDG